MKLADRLFRRAPKGNPAPEPQKGDGQNRKNARRADLATRRSQEQAALIEGLGNGHGRIAIPPLFNGGLPSSYEQRQLVNLARYLYANDGIVKGAIDDLARYSFPLVPQANSPDPEWNARAEEYFEAWSGYNADIKGRLHFGDLQRLISVHIDRDGDVGILFTKSAERGYALQLIEADRIIAHPDNPDAFPQGVKVDKYGRPVAYCVKADTKKGFRVLKGSSMLLMLEPERAEQVRGFSALKHAISHIRDKRDILTFEKQGVKNLSSLSAVLESEFDEADEDAWNLKQEEAAEPGGEATELTVSQMQSGAVPVLRKGEKLNAVQSNRPNVTFQGFLEFLVREFAVGMGLPFEFVWDTHGLTGPSQRFVMGKAQRKFKERQRLFGPLLKRTWFLVIGEAIESGKLKKQKGWNRMRIQTPATLTIDVGREAQQEREDVKMGLMSMREHYGKRGLDWQGEVDQQLAETKYLLRAAQKLAEEEGVSVDFILNRLQMVTPTQTHAEEKKENDE